MSYVTTATLLVAEYGDVKKDDILGHTFDHRGQAFKQMDDEQSGGYKFMECDLFAAGFNYVSGSDLEKWFESLSWGDLGAAFLVWDTNGEKRGSASVGWGPW